MAAGHPMIAVVTRETRLAGLKARWATAKQAAFRLQRAAAQEVEFRESSGPRARERLGRPTRRRWRSLPKRWLTTMSTKTRIAFITSRSRS